jgi:hypothetical protein
MHLVARLAAATFVLVGGGIHLDLWRSGYRGIPRVGDLFLANAVVSALLVLVVLATADRRVAVAGIAFSLSSLAALVLSRTRGFLGFTEPGWTDMAVQAVTAEVGAVVALTLLLVLRRRRPAPPALAVATAGGP